MPSYSGRKLTIGIVVPYLKSRGTEKQALALAKGFLNKKARVILFVVQGWGLQQMYDTCIDSGVEVVNVGSPVDVNQKKVSRSRIVALSKLAREYQCDVLLSRAGMANQTSGFAASLAGISSVAVVSSAASTRKTTRFGTFNESLSLLRWLFNRGFPTHVVTVSSEGREKIASAYPSMDKRITAINNGVNVEEVRSLASQQSSVVLPSEKFVLCFSGSIELERKGLDVLIEALDILVKRYKCQDINLSLIGTGDDQPALQSLIRSKRLTQYVTFVGELENPFSVVVQSDAFVLPSRREGFPNALLEAMALGICAIAADCNTGPREIITNETNGLLVPADDAVKLATAILKIKEDPSLRKRLAENGYKTIQQAFSYQHMVDSYYSLLTQLSSSFSDKVKL